MLSCSFLPCQVVLICLALPSPIHLHLRLSSHHRLSPRPSYNSCLAGCCVTSHHTTTSRLPVPLPLIAPPPLTAPLSTSYPAGCHATSHHAATSRLPAPLPLIAPFLHVLSGWLLHHLSSRLRLCLSLHHRLSFRPSCTSCPAGCCVTFHHAASSPICLCLRLSLHRRLSSHPSCASCLAGCHVTSRHAAISCPPVPPPLIAPPPLTTPLFASCPAGCHATSCHAAASHPPALPPLIAPLSCILSCWLLRHLLSHHRRLPSACASASHSTATSHHAPLPPLVRLVVASPLLLPPLPSVRLCLRLSLHCCLSPRPSCASYLAGCCVTSCHAAVSRPPAPLPLIASPPLTTPLSASWLAGCFVTSHHVDAFHPPAPPTLIASLPLVAPLLCLLSTPAGCCVDSPYDGTLRLPAPLPPKNSLQAMGLKNCR
jgi:hypothetical protein